MLRIYSSDKKTNRNAIDTPISGSDFDPGITIAVGLLRWLLDHPEGGDTDTSGIPWLLDIQPLKRIPSPILLHPTQAHEGSGTGSMG